MRLKKTSTEKAIEELTNQIKALIETQAVLVDGIKETRKLVEEVVSRVEEMSTTGEVVKLSLRRKTNIEELEILEKKVFEMEQRITALAY
ncbi:hypothetical protein HGB13_01380 [bacterium]|nr:hypothetical protein [bacterium]